MSYFLLFYCYALYCPCVDDFLFWMPSNEIFTLNFGAGVVNSLFDKVMHYTVNSPFHIYCVISISIYTNLLKAVRQKYHICVIL